MKISGFCDLNVSIPPQHLGPDCLEKLISLGYKTIALNTTVAESASEQSKKKKGQFKDAIPAPKRIEIPKKFSGKIQIIQRVTMHFSDGNQLQKLCKSDNAKKYDIISVIPTTFSAFQLACACKDIDLISFNPNERQLLINRRTYNLAVTNGIYFEIPYAPAIEDSGKRRNTIQIAQGYYTYGKSKNTIITSGATNTYKIRGPYDVANLGLLLGLTVEQAKHSMSFLSRALILRAEGRKFGKTAMTMTITDLSLESEEGSDSEPSAKKTKTDLDVTDSEMEMSS